MRVFGVLLVVSVSPEFGFTSGRITLNPATLELTRGIVAEDPVYFVDKYVDWDSVLPADAPFRVEACKERAPEYQQTGRK